MLLVYALEDACNNLVGPNLITSLKALAQKGIHALLPLHRRGQLQSQPRVSPDGKLPRFNIKLQHQHDTI